MTEQFDIKKFIGGFVNPVTGAKSLVIGAWLVVFLIVGYTFYKAYIKKQPPTTVQNAEHIDSPNYYLQPKFGGCARIVIPAEKK